MVTVNYERFSLEQHNSKWEIITKEFSTLEDAYRFIERIAANVQVGRVWIKK